MSNAQTMSALALANEIRSKRAAEKKRIYGLSMTDGRKRVADLLEDTPDWLATERIGKLLSWPRRTGLTFASRMLVHVASPHWPVSFDTRVHMLTPAQRERLANALRNGRTFDA